MAFICPLAIDELPLSKAFENQDPMKIEFAQFDRDNLALEPVDSGRIERMGLCAKPGTQFRTEDVQNASGSILTDVGWRDYRLVEQANALAVFNPFFIGDTVSRGVANEIMFAGRFSHRIHLSGYVDSTPATDTLPGLKALAAGLWGQAQKRQLIVRKDSLDDLFTALN